MAQYDNWFRSIVGPSSMFKKIESELIPNRTKRLKDSIGEKRVIYSYYLNNSFIKLEYSYPQSIKDRSCAYFIIGNSRINLSGRYDHNFACDLDVNSFELYTAEFNEKNYILLTCINTGSGSFATTIICHLFDITNKSDIKYYPLWSKYGSSTCFGDFNNDGKLDFLKIRNIEGDYARLRISIETLDNGSFTPFKENLFFIDLRITGEAEYKILTKKWFK